MSVASSIHRFASALVLSSLVVAVVATSTTPTAKADITYNLVNYPASQGGDTLSGQITTNGNLSTPWTNDFVSASFVITTPGGVTYTVPSANVYPIGVDIGTLPTGTANSGSLLLPSGDAFALYGPTSESGGTADVELDFVNYTHASSYTPEVRADLFQSAGGGTTIFADFNITGTPGSIGSNQPWIVATTVPEPTTLTLFVTALLGLVGFLFVRRQRGAA
jgi:hypothetical protein